ncbi:hypothetical protein Q8A67_012193 [Cirrhinus molitorella]|uniref:TIR domain-containing protein n=1 Tax=Cirrhinus molitorella TaxID=172907 RepID=A0AA88TMJ6_9TELE|nr:hypothetical protein Q8A67_012193 [Cirrhinus molitorella]
MTHHFRSHELPQTTHADLLHSSCALRRPSTPILSLNNYYILEMMEKNGGKPHQQHYQLVSSAFWKANEYDVFVCHNDEDSDVAQSLTCFLENPSNGLRCYLQERDCPAGGAVSTELLQAVQDSHCWLLLITPNFVKDDWCLYQMHQVLSEGPMSQRIIPAIVNMPRSKLPLELRFLFTVDLNMNKEFGYTQVYRAVIHYLKDMSEKEKPRNASQSDG